MVRGKSATRASTEFALILAVCRSAVAGGDEVQRHQVQRLCDHFEKEGQTEQAAALRELLQGSDRTRTLTPFALKPSRAALTGEPMSRGVKPPVDKETAVPLAEVLWPEDLPAEPPVLPPELERAIANLVSEWHHAEALAQVAVTPTRSALLFGLPGTGKTHLAQWLARQLGLPIVVARLDGLISSFLGTTSRNIGHLFAFAARYQCVLLLDEFDAVAKLRDDPHELGEIKRVVNTILQHLDERRSIGFTIGITNHEKLLDPAVWRRFEVQLHLPPPSIDGRLAILRTYLRPMELSPARERFLAWLCEGMSGSEIETVMQSYKRLSVLQASTDPTFFDLCRLTVGLHGERVTPLKRALLNEPLPNLAKALAQDPEIASDLATLADLFGKSKSTVARWANP